MSNITDQIELRPGRTLLKRVSWAKVGSLVASIKEQRWWQVVRSDKQPVGSFVILRPSATVDWLYDDADQAVIYSQDVIATWHEKAWQLRSGEVLVQIDQNEGDRVKVVSEDLQLKGPVIESRDEDVPVGWVAVLDIRSPALFVVHEGSPHFICPSTSLAMVMEVDDED